jgi:hypothetical protein
MVGQSRKKHSSGLARTALASMFVCATLSVAFGQVVPAISAPYTPDPGCTAQQAWPIQVNPIADPSGKNNIENPLQVASYWITGLTGTPGSVLTIHGQFPAARFMSIEADDSNQNFLADLFDAEIVPDAGQNNPFVSGGSAAQGTYTLTLIFGPVGASTPPNTMYMGTTTSITLTYRVYYPNDYVSNPGDLVGGTTSPVLPTLNSIPTCGPRPVLPLNATVWGTLPQNNFVGVQPATAMSVTNPPTWSIFNTGTLLSNQENDYMSATLSRKYLTFPYQNDVAVIQMLTPTFANTQAGVPAYTAENVRFWGICSDEPVSTGLVRCIADAQAPLVNNLATFVISDPSKQPSAAVLNHWGASWVAWGALLPGQSVYGSQEQLMTNADGVFYYDRVLYRQTLASSSFIQSIANVSQLPASGQQAAMGAYWPVIGYCRLAAFVVQGPACLGR